MFGVLISIGCAVCDKPSGDGCREDSGVEHSGGASAATPSRP